MKWKIENLVVASDIPDTWMKYRGQLEEAIREANALHRAGYLTYELVKSYTEDFDKTQNRRKKFEPMTGLTAGRIYITNGATGKVMFVIKKP
jgi:hypothetical protein